MGCGCDRAQPHSHINLCLFNEQCYTVIASGSGGIVLYQLPSSVDLLSKYSVQDL